MGKIGGGLKEKKRKMERDKAIELMLIKQASTMRFSHRLMMKQYLRRMELGEDKLVFVLNSQDHFIKKALIS